MLFTAATELQKLAHACDKAAHYYCEKPGHAGPEAVIDLYRVISALANVIETELRQQQEQPIQRKRTH